MRLADDWQSGERRAHRDGAPGLDQLVAAVTAGQAVWLRGGVGRGKTHWLRQVAAALALQPGDGWRIVRLDLLDVPAPAAAEWALCDALAAALDQRGRMVQAVPDFEWLLWLDRGPGELLHDELDDAVAAQLGCGLRAARRRFGPTVLAGELARIAAEHGWPRPDLIDVTERLTFLCDQAYDPERPLLLLLDNLDALPPAQALPLLDSLIDELPLRIVQPFALVAASTSAPPPGLAPQLRQFELPRLPWHALAPAGLVADEAVQRLLADLAEAHPEPVNFSRQVIEESRDRSEAPLLTEHLLHSATLRGWLADRLPHNGELLSDEPAGRVTSRLLLLGAAGRPAEAPAELLDDLSAGQRAAMASDPRLEIADRLRLRPLDAAELRLFQACRSTQADQPAHAALAVREARLATLAARLPRTLAWDNLVYAGEVRCGPEFQSEWNSTLPPECGWRLVVLTRSVPGPKQLADPRIVVLAPPPIAPDELPELRLAAALAQVAETHPEPETRDLAAGWLAGAEPAGLERAAALLRQGTATATPVLVDTWRESQANLSPAGWVGALFRNRFADLHRERRRWVQTDALDEPLEPGQLDAVWQALRVRGGAGEPIVAALGLLAERPAAGLTDLRDRLTARAGVLSGEDTLAWLTAPPVGLTIELAKLHLLAMVLRGDPELVLEASADEAGPAVYDAQRLRGTVWQAIAPHTIRRLRRADRRSWEELRPFAEALVPDLTAGLTAAEREAGQAALLAALGALAERTQQVVSELTVWAGELEQPVPEAVIQAAEKLRQVAAVAAWDAFDRQLTAVFAGDPAAWVAALDTFRAGEAVVEALPALVHAVARMSRQRIEHDPLEADRQALLGQIRLARLVGNPSLLRSLLSRIGQYDRQYVVAYRAAHARRAERFVALQPRVRAAEAMGEALQRLNDLSALGPEDSPAEAMYLDSMLHQLRPCHATGEPDDTGACPACWWHLRDDDPVGLFESVFEQVQTAFEARTGRLRAMLTEELIQRHGEDRLEALHQVLAVQQAGGLPEVLSEETVALLADCLPVPTFRSDVLKQLRRRWPAIEPADVEAVASDLAALLRAAFAASDEEEPRLSME